jgi:hypothetical protein
VDDDRSRGGGAADLPAEGRLSDRGRLQTKTRPLRRTLWRRSGGDLGGGYGTGWDVFEQAMARVLPNGKFVDLDASHPIFHSFFEVDRLDIVPQAYVAGRPVFRGLFEDNDQTKRLQVIVNYNTDISQFWEWSGTGLRPIDETNEAYKLGVNYIIYGLTH